ncbi:MAG: pyruvate kinase [Patescibacteria group bacterium]|nr:pyruvate kinase [Patescibacteria group bacterium]
MEKFTKIVATIGPSSERYEIIKKIVEAGVNVARLNFSHGTYANHAKLIRNLRRAERVTGQPVAIMQDIRGPKIRLGVLPEEGIKVKTGAVVVLDSSPGALKKGAIPLDYAGLEKFVKVGDRILADDGHAEFKVKSKKGAKIICQTVEGYTLKSHKGLNFPDSHLNVPILSDKDKKDLMFGVKMGVDIVALSFVSKGSDIKDLRRLVAKYEKKLRIKEKQPVFVVAKIERNEALDNIDEIIKEADGVMVARGDLAMETTLAEMPLIQKTIIDKANQWVKPVIVATQMLDSMQIGRRPTRAEITDVANAVIDHADALMLSNETASGKYPVETVKTMSDIILATEKSKYDDVDLYKEVHPHKSISKAIAGISGILAAQVGAKATLVASATGYTGRLVSRVRVEMPVFVGAQSERTVRQLCLSWGVRPFLLPKKKSVETLIKSFMAFVKKKKIAKKGDRVVVITGEPVGKPGSTNLIEVRELK